GGDSVIVPLPSVVVVVVVVSDTCAHAKGATTAKAILSSIFFILFPLFFSAGRILLLTRFARMLRMRTACIRCNRARAPFRLPKAGMFMAFAVGDHVPVGLSVSIHQSA